MRRQIRLPALLSGSDVIFLLLNKITKINNVLMARSFREEGMSTQCLLLTPATALSMTTRSRQGRLTEITRFVPPLGL